MNRTTSKITSVALIVLTLGVNEGLAQATTTAQQEACRPDVFRLCGSDIPDVGRIVACLRGNESRLSAAWHQVVFAEPTLSEGYASRSHFRANVE